MVLHNLVNVQKKIRLDVYESALDGFFFRFFFSFSWGTTCILMSPRSVHRERMLFVENDRHNLEIIHVREGGGSERERERDRARAGPPGLQMKE